MITILLVLCNLFVGAIPTTQEAKEAMQQRMECWRELDEKDEKDREKEFITKSFIKKPIEYRNFTVDGLFVYLNEKYTLQGMQNFDKKITAQNARNKKEISDKNEKRIHSEIKGGVKRITEVGRKEYFTPIKLLYPQWINARKQYFAKLLVEEKRKNSQLNEPEKTKHGWYIGWLSKKSVNPIVDTVSIVATRPSVKTSTRPAATKPADNFRMTR